MINPPSWILSWCDGTFERASSLGLFYSTRLIITEGVNYLSILLIASTEEFRSPATTYSMVNCVIRLFMCEVNSMPSLLGRLEQFKVISLANLHFQRIVIRWLISITKISPPVISRPPENQGSNCRKLIPYTTFIHCMSKYSMETCY